MPCPQVKCPKCGFVSCTSHPFLALELEISRSSSLTQALQQHTAQERLDASNMWRCDKHKGMVQASKQLLLGRLPPVLVLSLKRFSGHSRGRKLSKQVGGHVSALRLRFEVLAAMMLVCWVIFVDAVLYVRHEPRQLGVFRQPISGTCSAGCCPRKVACLSWRLTS